MNFGESVIVTVPGEVVEALEYLLERDFDEGEILSYLTSRVINDLTENIGILQESKEKLETIKKRLEEQNDDR